MIDAKLKFGDEDGDIAALVVHSKTKADLRKLKTSTGVPLFIDGINGDVDRFTGIPVFTSDRMRVSGANYTSLVLKRNAVLFWMNGAPIVLTDKDILANSDVQAMHIYWAVHPYKRLPGMTKPGVVRIIHKVGS
jgi:HK97 family phage major capsid protein